MIKGKIFVVYHFPKEIVKSDIYQPIAVGQNKDLFGPDFLRDDTGDNIANKNNRYNELTAIYWVYKHLSEFNDCDYIGFCHYRRFFCYNGLDKNAYVKKKVDHSLIEIDDEKIAALLKDYDFVCPRSNHYSSVRRHYEKAHNEEDVDIILNIIKENKIEFYDSAKTYFSGQKEYSYNMFIFKRDMFAKYCEFLFEIIDIFAKKTESVRLYMSERITGVFIQYLIDNGLIPICLPVLHVREKSGRLHTDKKEKGFMKAKPAILELLPICVEECLRRKKAK